MISRSSERVVRGLIVAATALSLACGSPGVKDGAAAGALTGALAGAVAASSDRGEKAVAGAVIGGVVGAVVGYVLVDRDRSGPDGDSDGIVDVEDNCPNVANKDQQDVDGDGVGDRCEKQ